VEFAYHRSLAPLMWVFVALASLEALVVHPVMSALDWRVALALTAISVSSIAWFVLLIRSFKRLPVMVGEGQVLFRAGTLRKVAVPLGNIAAVRRNWPSEALKAPGVLNLGLMAYPNVLIELREPMAGRRPVVAIAHKFDDPDAFVAALEGV
jgi:hypothetical protein